EEAKLAQVQRDLRVARAELQAVDKWTPPTDKDIEHAVDEVLKSNEEFVKAKAALAEAEWQLQDHINRATLGAADPDVPRLRRRVEERKAVLEKIRRP